MYWGFLEYDEFENVSDAVAFVFVLHIRLLPLPMMKSLKLYWPKICHGTKTAVWHLATPC